MNYIESDSKELQEIWEQLISAIQDLESSDNLPQVEKDQKAQIVRRLNRRYSVLSNRARYNRVLEVKMERESQIVKFIKGLAIGIGLGLFWYITAIVLVK